MKLFKTKNIYLVFTLVTAFLFVNCASIFTGSHRKVKFETSPPGAIVYVNGKNKGVTPIKLSINSNDKVYFKLENYKEEVVVMDSKFNLVAILNGFNLIGWGIDAITGSFKRVKTNYVRVSLEKEDNNTALLEYLSKGSVTEVNINDKDKIIQTTIILD